MIHWFMKQKKAVLLGAPLVLLGFVLLITAGLSQSLEQVENSDGGKDYEEVFFAGDTNGMVYINWQEPKATNDSFCAAWFLGAYKYGSHGLCIDLNRGILSNNLYYAINYSAGDNSLLFLNLLDTNGIVLAESDDLLTASNVVRYAGSTGTQSNGDERTSSVTNTILLLDIPTAQYPEAAVIQLRSDNINIASPSFSGLVEQVTITVHEGLLFINDGTDSWLTDGQGNGTSGYSPDGNGSISNYYEWINDNSNGGSTNNTGGGGDEPGEDDDDSPGKSKIIYVDQAIGNDAFTGRASTVSASKKGPKKTVRGGLSIAGTNDTIIIRSGNYNENLNIMGKDVKVFIEGNVRL